MELCNDELQKEFRKILKEDPDFVQLQTTITAMKVAEKVLKRKNLSTQSLEAYAKSIIGPRTQEYIKNNQDKLNALYNKHAKEEMVSASEENILKSLETGDRLSDGDLRKMMITLKTMQPDQFSFEESDFAITWFLDEVATLNGSTNNIMSRVVKGVLDFDVYSPEKFKEQQDLIGKTLARAQKELAGKLAGIRTSIFTRHKDICLDLYGKDNNDSSNQSIFAYCGYKDRDIVENSFLKALTDIKHGLLPKTAGFASIEKPVNNNERRKIQDEINSLSSDKERVVAFYKSQLNPKREECAHFAVVDKKKFTTEIYNNDGILITSLDSIVGSNRRDDKHFNPDASLQLFQNGTYTRTTTAGIFHVMGVGDERKKNDYYKDEFNNQVLVLGKETVRGDKLVEEEEKIMAIHGVPNSEWMGSDGKLKKLGNKKERMESFTGNKNKKLSTGCVNLEGFSYEVMDELIPASCPIVVLPEDDKNFMYAKNFSLAYSTDIEDRFLGKENAHKWVDKKLVVDENNFNRYNFSSPLRVSHTKKVNGGDENLQAIFEERQNFLKKYKNLESDDYELILSLSFARGGSLEEMRGNLDSMAKGLEEKRFSSKFQLLDSEEKAKEILADYLIDERMEIIKKAQELVFE